MSDLMNDPMVLRQILMDHYEYPRNHELTHDETYYTRHMASDSCIDDIHVEAKIEDRIIKDIRFDGVACTIATAATSIMSELLMGKNIDDANHIINNYHAMIDGKEYDADLLEEAIALHTVGKQANRIKCATIGWKAMEEMIAESESKNG
jgi:nitrogen fixation NifU-like protein